MGGLDENYYLKKLEKDTEKGKDTSNKMAIALSYDGTNTAPTVVATGKGYVADKILETAKKENVPIHKDEKLAKTLSKLELGDAIPKELYKVVAEILIYVNDMDTLKEKIDGKQKRSR